MDSKIRLIVWDLIFLTTGAFFYVAGYNVFAAGHDFIPTGAYGLALLFKNIMPQMPTYAIYFAINVPLFIIALKGVSLKFLLLNFYCMGVITLLIPLITFTVPIDNVILSAIATGAVMGVGVGFIFRSSGGGGGFDVLAVIVNLRFGVRIGVFFFVVNCMVMLFAATQVSVDTLIVSILMLFITSVTTDRTMDMFNQRKEVKIITKKFDELCERLKKYNISATLIEAQGLYTKERYPMVMVIANNFQLKKIEKIAFSTDSDAIYIVNNTFNVIGKSISPRKEY